MIHGVTGVPGAGKTYYLLRQLVWWLRHTELPVVTNLVLREGRLQEYLRGLGFAESILDRLTVLSDEECCVFWRYRGRGEVWPAGGCGRVWPVVYILMEFHQFFSVRDWNKVSAEASWYASQHRHFGDEIWFDTQHPDMIAKQFRILVGDWTFLRNWGHESWLGFAAPRKVRWVRSLFAPSGGGEVKGMDSGWFTIDLRGLANCYETAGGVGMPRGADADVSVPRSRGLPWWVGVGVALVLVVGVAFQVPSLLGRVFGFGARSLSDKVMSGVRGGVGFVSGVVSSNAFESAGVSGGGGVASLGLDVEGSKTASESGSGSGDAGVRLTALCGDGSGRVYCGLSDGRSIRPEAVDWVRGRVLYCGRWYTF